MSRQVAAPSVVRKTAPLALASITLTATIAGFRVSMATRQVAMAPVVGTRVSAAQCAARSRLTQSSGCPRWVCAGTTQA